MTRNWRAGIHFLGLDREERRNKTITLIYKIKFQTKGRSLKNRPGAKYKAFERSAKLLLRKSLNYSPSSFLLLSVPLIITLGSQGCDRGAAVVAFVACVELLNETKSVRLVTRISLQLGPVSKCGTNFPPMYTSPPSSFCWKSGAEKASDPKGNEQCDHVGQRKLPRWVT